MMIIKRFRRIYENSYNMKNKMDQFSGSDNFYKNLAFKIYP